METNCSRHCSFAIDDSELTQWLIDNGANIDVRSSLDEPVIANAIAHGSMSVVRLLLAHGPDLKHGNLLDCAAERSNHVEGAVLMTLLDPDSTDVNAYRYNNPIARDLRGMSKLFTALHIACLRQNVPVARALLQYGAEPDCMAFEAGRLVPPTARGIPLGTDNPKLQELFVNEDETKQVKVMERNGLRDAE